GCWEFCGRSPVDDAPSQLPAPDDVLPALQLRRRRPVPVSIMSCPGRGRAPLRCHSLCGCLPSAASGRTRDPLRRPSPCHHAHAAERLSGIVALVDTADRPALAEGTPYPRDPRQQTLRYYPLSQHLAPGADRADAATAARTAGQIVHHARALAGLSHACAVEVQLPALRQAGLLALHSPGQAAAAVVALHGAPGASE